MRWRFAGFEYEYEYRFAEYEYEFDDAPPASID